MQLTIHSEIIKQFPALRVGVISLRTEETLDGQVASAALSTSIATARNKFTDFAAAESDQLLAVWPEVYRRMGLNPKRTKPTVNALYDRILRGRDLAIPLPIVAASVAVCIDTRLPVGGYDLDRVMGDIHLRPSAGGEPFLGVGDSEPGTTHPGEIVYADDAGVLTRAWNHRDSDRTKLSSETRSIGLMMEAPTAQVSGLVLEDGIAALVVLLRGIGATVDGVATLDASVASVRLR